jgi:hypothetical protein
MAVAYSIASHVISEANPTFASLPDEVYVGQSIVHSEAVVNYSGLTVSKHPWLSAGVFIERYVSAANAWFQVVSYNFPSRALSTVSGSSEFSYDLTFSQNLTDGDSCRVRFVVSLSDDDSGYNGLESFKAFTFRTYTAPLISVFLLRRCLEDGTPDNLGTYVEATIQFSESSIGGSNTKELKVYRRLTSEEDWTPDSTLDISALGLSDTYGPALLALTYDSDVAYDVKAEFKDLISTAINTQLVSAGITTFDYDTVSHQVSVGKRVDQNGAQFQVDKDAEFGGDVKVGGNLLFGDIATALAELGIQFGSFTTSTAVGGQDAAPQTFAHPYAAAPKIFFQLNYAGAGFTQIFIVPNPVSETGFTPRVYNEGGASRGTQTVFWIAVGTPAT